MRTRPATVLRALLGACAVVAGVIACSGIITGPDAGPDTSPRSMRVTPPRLELSLTDTARMSADLYDVTGAAAVLDPAIRLVFSSANPLIARVDDAGLVTAVADGTTTVTAAYGGFSLGIPVIVLGRPRLVIVSGDAQTTEQGDTLPLPLVVRALDAAGLPAANRSVTFGIASGSGALFAVQSLSDVNGLASARWVLGLPLGAQSVAVTSAGSDSALFAATATAGTRPVRVAISAPLASLAGPGETTTMTAAVFNVANVALPAASVTWTSRSPAVATVSGTGLVTALTPGTAYIRAASGSAADSVIVTVNVPPSIAVAPAALTSAWTVGSAVPAAQAVAVTNGGGGSLSGLSSSITYGAGATDWLSAALNATVAPATLTVTLVPGSTSAGTYTATVRVASSLAGVAARDVAVTLTVSPPAVLPKLQLGADFTHPAGLQVARGLSLPAALSGAQSFTLRSLDTEAILLAADGGTLGGSSISVNALAGATSVPYWVQGMERSSGTVARLVAEAVGFEPDTIDVTMVRPAARLTLVGPSTVQASGGDDPVLQVTVGRNDGGTLVPMQVRAFGVAPTFDVFATDFIALMRFRATAATNGADQGPTICVSFDLRPGQSATTLPDPAASVPASLSVVRSGAAGTAGFVLTSLVTEYDIIGGNPSLTITAVPVPVIAVAPTSLTFNATVGAADPPAQQVAITNVGAGTLSGLSSSAVINGVPADWFSTVALDVTTAPATLTVSTSTNGIPPGTYTATITVASSVAGVAPVAIPVTLVIAPAVLPKLALGPDLMHPAGLQAERSVSVPSSVVDPVVVTFRSLDPTALLIGSSAAGVGAATDSAEIEGGTDQAFYWLSGIEGTAGRAVTLIASAPGYLPDTMVVTLKRPSFQLTPAGATSVPASGGDDPVILLGVGDVISGAFVPMAVRIGGTPPSFTLTSASPAVARLRFVAGNGVVGADQGPANQITFGIDAGTNRTSSGQFLSSPANILLARTGTAGTVQVDAVGSAEYDGFLTGVPYALSGAPVPVIAVAPPAIAYTAPLGATVPLPRQLAITNTGASTLSGLTADVLYGAGASDWLSVAFDVTTAPATLTVVAFTDFVPVGTFTATITLASTVPGVAPVNIPVTITITPGARIVIVSGNGQSAARGQYLPDSLKVRAIGLGDVPVGDQTVEFTVSANGGSVSLISLETDENGYAAVRWLMPSVPGTYTVTAGFPGYASAVFTGTALAGTFVTRVQLTAPRTSLTGAGDSQQFAAAAYNIADSLIASAVITWTSRTATVATVSPTGLVTAVAAGQSWIVASVDTGSGSGIDSVLVTVAAPPPPTLVLALVNTPLVGVNGTAIVRVTLSQPAPIGGVSLSLVSGEPSVAIVNAPASVTVAAGATSADFTLTGISTGGVTLSATATGYTTGTLAVTVSTNTISVPLTLNVPYTRSASLPINLTQPAPVGGTLITITSGNPAIVGVLTPTVLIPAGQLSGNAQLAGTTLGQVAVTATGPNLATGTSSVRVTAALDILESSVSINAGFSTTSVTTRLLSGGTPFAAPAGGIPLTFTSRNPACVAAPTAVAVAAGLSSVATTAGYGGSASTPCATYLVVTSSQFDPDSMAITVNPQPLSYLNVSASVGAGLTRGASFSFQVVAPPGGAVVTLTSSDSTRLVLSRTADVVGTGSIQITIPPGSYYDSFVYSGVEGQEGLGASISLTVQGGLYASPTPAPVTITPIGVEATGTTSFTTLSADGTGTVFVGEIGAPGPSQAVNNALIVRAGGSPITVTLTSDDDAVVRPVSAGIAATTRTVTINPGQSSTTYGIRPVGAGTARISASSPNAASPVRTSYPAAITVSQPLSYLNVPATVGAGLTKNASFSMQVVAPPGGIVVTLTSSDSTRLVLARTADVVGTGSIQITIPAGGYYDSFVMSGVEGQAGAAASVSMTVQGGLFANPAPVPVSISTIGIQTSISTSLTTLSADGTGAVYVGELGAPGPSQAVNNALIVRAGGQPITVTLTSADAGVVVPVTASVAGNPRTVTINPGQSSTTFGVRPTGPGSTTISATSPSAASPVATNYPVPITVTQPLSYLNVSSVVGAGLTRAASFSLQVIAPPGGTVVTITSSDSTRLVLARTSDVVGTGSIQITIPAGGYYDSFYMSGVEGQQGTTASVIMTVQGGLFSNPAPGPVTIVPIGVEATGSTSLTTLGGDGNGTVFVGELAAPGPSQAVTNTLNIRAGGQPITVTLTSTTPTVAVPVVAGVAASPRTVTINPGQSSATYSIRPLVAGTTTITATSPQAPSPVRASYPSVLTVTSPSSSLSLPTRLGAGLSTTATVSLQVVAPVGGANITLTSSDPARLLLALDANSPGATQLTVPIPQGGYYASFVVMALEDITGNPTVTAQTPGFTDATGAISVEPIGVQWAGTTSMTTLSTDGSGTVFVGIITGVVGNRSVTPVQAIRFGGVARTITMTSSNAAAVLPVVAGSAQQGATVTIDPGQSSAPVYVRPVGPGSATLSPSGAGLIPADAPGVPQTVTVTVPVQSLSITSFTQGAGLAQVPTIALQVVAPAGGRTMTLTSNDPSRLLVAPNENTAGASQISIAFGAGSYYQSFVVMSPENVSGTVTLTASIPGYRDTTFTFTVAQPAVTLNGPPSTRTIAQGDDFFQAQVGIQSGAGVQPQVVRFGAPAALTVTLASSAPAIGTLVIGGNVASPQTIEIAVGQSLSSSIAGTRANFRPLSAGNATITATIPGYLQQGNAIRTVTVSP